MVRVAEFDVAGSETRSIGGWIRRSLGSGEIGSSIEVNSAVITMVKALKPF
jgi:hypothetical protein